MTGQTLRFRLNGYNFPELDYSKRTAIRYGNSDISSSDIQIIWLDISITLDKYKEGKNSLVGLQKLETSLIDELGPVNTNRIITASPLFSSSKA